MAEITTTVTPAAVRLPLIAPVGEPEIWWTHYPKAEIQFQQRDFLITASGVGDTQRLLIDCALQTSYAYTLVDLSLAIFGNENVDNWGAECNVDLLDNTEVNWSIPIPFIRNTDTPSGPGFYRAFWPPHRLPQKTILSTSTGSLLRLQLSNATTNNAQITGRFYARFLQFDLNQGYRTSIQSPILTR